MLYQRTRDIEDSMGTCLRVIVTACQGDVVVSLQRMDIAEAPQIKLSPYGAEILTGFIMAARLSVPSSMPDEEAQGEHAARFHLSIAVQPTIFVEQDKAGNGVCITAPMWDKLYAELCLVTAHTRNLIRRCEPVLH
jgi:hypothetical protein